MVSIPLPRLFKLRVSVAWECLKEDVGFLAHARRVQPEHSDGLAILADIRRDGFHVLRGFYDPSICADLIREIDAIVAMYPDRLELDPEGSDHRIWGSEKVSAEIRGFFEDRVVKSFAESYLRTRVANMTTLGAKLVARAANMGSGGGWHRDSMFEKQLKAIIYLGKVGEENGPFNTWLDRTLAEVSSAPSATRTARPI
jgi:hypothetical protein